MKAIIAAILAMTVSTSALGAERWCSIDWPHPLASVLEMDEKGWDSQSINRLDQPSRRCEFTNREKTLANCGGPEIRLKYQSEWFMALDWKGGLGPVRFMRCD